MALVNNTANLVFSLSENEHHVSKAVAMKTRQHLEIRLRALTHTVSECVVKTPGTLIFCVNASKTFSAVSAVGGDRFWRMLWR